MPRFNKKSRFLYLLFLCLICHSSIAFGEIDHNQHIASATLNYSSVSEVLSALKDKAISIQGDPLSLPVYLSGSIVLDGYLSEDIWQKALVWSLDYEISQAENRPAPVPTLFLIAVTGDDLVFAFIAFDPSPESIRYTLTDRDRIQNDDRVYIVMDTFGDQRSGFEIFINPVGVQADALRSESGVGGRRRGPGNRQEDFNFDFLWDAVSRLYDDGYIVEGRIPLKSLRYQLKQEGMIEWRLSPFREYPRDFAYRMSPIRWDFNNACFLCQLPVVHIKLQKPPANNIQVIPYLSGNRNGASGEQTQTEARAGLDVKYQPNPRVVIDATLFPDFSQVETDAFQITSNTRFAPFLPEKRPFFLERSDLFATPLQAVYTRTIIDPEVGSRVTGKWGNHTFALLSVIDNQTQLLFPAPLESDIETLETRSLNNILRYRYDIGDRTNFGLLITDKEYESGYNRVGGIDFRTYLDKTTVLTTQALFTRTRYPSYISETFNQSTAPIDGWAYYVQVNRNSRNWEFRVEWQEFDEDFRADLGFIQQAGVRELEAMNAFIFWPQGGLIKRWSLFVFGRSRWDRSNNPQAQRLTIGSFILGAAQSRLFIRMSAKRDRVENVLIDSQDITLDFNLAPTPWYQGGIRISIGSDPDFNLAIRAFRIDARLEQNFLIARRIQLGADIRWLTLSDGHRLQDNLATLLRVEWQITRRWAIRQIFQWQRVRFLDERYRILDKPLKEQRWESQTLLRYRINYATALYAGFYGRWTNIDNDRESKWNVFMKIAYLFNF